MANLILGQSDGVGNFQLDLEHPCDSLYVSAAHYPLQAVAITGKSIRIELHKTIDRNSLFAIVDQTATYPGGMGKFYDYVRANLKFPAEALRKGVSGRAFVEFIISSDGTIEKNSVRILKGLHPECDAEAIRIFHESPPWNPGKVEGVAVRQKMVLPVNFVNDKKKG